MISFVVATDSAEVAASVDRRRTSVVVPLRRWEVLPLVALLGVIGAVAWHAFTTVSVMDLSGYYHGADFGWLQGNVWNAYEWIGTPFLALIAGPLTVAMPITQFAWLVTLVNLVLMIALAGTAFVWARRRVSPFVAWPLVFALTLWGPVAGTVWWKQVNLFSVAAVVAGFVLLRRHPWWAAALIGAGIAIKPLAILLPLFLLFHRGTRRAALAAIGSTVAFTGAGLVYLAWRARDFAAADPFEYWRRFDTRSGIKGSLVCTRGNMSPISAACTLLGQDFTPLRALVLAGVGVVIVLALASLRNHQGTSLAVLAWACLLSPMLSTLEWPHYGIVMAPMFVYLVVRFVQQRATVEYWIALAAAYVVTQLVWNPAMSLPAQVRVWFGGVPETPIGLGRETLIGSVGQYALVAVALAWFGRERTIGEGPPGMAGRTSSQSVAVIDDAPHIISEEAPRN